MLHLSSKLNLEGGLTASTQHQLTLNAPSPAGYNERFSSQANSSLYELGFNGYRQDNNSRRPPTQSQGRKPRAATQSIHCRDRAVGVRQIEPRFRHHLRRRPAPLRRTVVG